MTVRAARFGDGGEFIHYQGPSLSLAERSYFAGDEGVARMDLIRTIIKAVRESWPAQGAQVPAPVRDFVTGIRSLPEGTTHEGLLETIAESLRNNPDWADRIPESVAPADGWRYPLIRLYTSNEGYGTLFANMNQMYRRADPLAHKQVFTAMTWLVELLTMELFALTHRNPERHGRGTVFRGMTLPQHLYPQYARFADTDLPLQQRSVSIPLGFHSTSMSRETAMEFFSSREAVGTGTDRFNVLWQIEIASLSEDKLALYRQVYPHSVVSTACATDISHQAAYFEGEVLLRGPFFQVLDLRPSAPVDGVPTYVLDAVMLDSNRDHFSTLELADRDPVARRLFNALVGWERSEVCARSAQAAGKSPLAMLYGAAAGNAREDAMASARGGARMVEA